jgi:SnoaL-like domain
MLCLLVARSNEVAPPRGVAIDRNARRRMSGEAALNALLAKQEIYECIMRYARGSDRYDKELMRSTFHPEAVVEREKVWELEEFLSLSMARDRSRARMHHMGNVLIELDGLRAVAETYWLAYQVWTEADTRFVRTRAARYVDRFECRAGTWKVLYRGVVDDWSYVQEVGPEIGSGHSNLVGAPFPMDPIYRVLEH